MENRAVGKPTSKAQRMIPEGPEHTLPPWSPRVWRGPVALILLALTIQLGGAATYAALRYQRAAIEAGQWWRLLSGNLVHLGWYHLGLNVLALLVLIALCAQPLRWRDWWARVGILGAGVGAGLYLFAPGINNYAGLSGLVHGLFVLGLWPLVRKGDVVAVGCFAFLIAKLAYECVSGAPLSDARAIGGSVVTESHLFGALTAIGYGCVRSRRGRRAVVHETTEDR